MKIFVAIDDTDNIDSRGTGELAEMIAEVLVAEGWGKITPITRHQLYIHPDIPYTSHNSSMCFEAQIKPDYLDTFTSFAGEFLQRESAPGSDPGLCIVAADFLQNPQELMNFGYRAKEKIITKEEAYQLAEKLNIHLSEHGGTGQGIIGALAGTGLRMSVNDGRFRGKLKIKSADGTASVDEIKKQTIIEEVKSLEGYISLNNSEKIALGEKVKAVMLDGKCTLLVFPADMETAKWQTCTTSQLKIF